MDEHVGGTFEGRCMSIIFKINRSLLQDIRKDLARPHPFAYERVGFISAGFSAERENLWVFAQAYRPIADEDYLDDPTVGAMMGPEAIRKALQWAMSGLGIFHVHTHCGFGLPAFGALDLREQAKFVPNFFQLAPKQAHGALVLSDDSCNGNIWLSSSHEPEQITDFVEVGSPLTIWKTS